MKKLYVLLLVFPVSLFAQMPPPLPGMGDLPEASVPIGGLELVLGISILAFAQRKRK